MARTILIAAGGTGGHLFPGIAVADELRRPRCRRRASSSWARREGWSRASCPGPATSWSCCPSCPSTASASCACSRALLALPWAMVKAVAARPRACGRAAVLGVGGYAGGPVVLVAALLRIPTVILEPNAKPGFTNRVLRAVRAPRRLLVRGGAARVREQGRGHGQPRARRLREARPASAHAPPLTLLAFGGSQGVAHHQPRAGRRAAPPARAATACASSTRRARPCATRWRPRYDAAGREAEVARLPRRHGDALRRRPTSSSAAAAPPPAPS